MTETKSPDKPGTLKETERITHFTSESAGGATLSRR
jgi:hypothetical protein